jgi:hypothetical protein
LIAALWHMAGSPLPPFIEKADYSFSILGLGGLQRAGIKIATRMAS